MAMFYYNPNQGKRNLDSKDSNWTAEIGEGSLKGKLVVIEKETKYIVDGFENKTGYEFEKEDIWYSFDPNTGNFHIVPDGTVKITLNDWLRITIKCISAEVNEVLGKVSSSSGGNKACTYNHRYVLANVGDNQYLMSFNRLWCDSDNHIHNYFGQAQFMCYPKEHGDINRVSDRTTSGGRSKYKFEMMYPSSGKNYKYKAKDGHFTYNPPYDINKPAEAIAKGFVEFIKWCEDNEKTP